METNFADYSPKGVKFYYVYKALAHPEYNRYVTPFTLQERLMHVTEAKRRLRTRIPWLCDSISNDLRHAIGPAPNGEFLIDPEGKVVVARVWSDPVALRSDLEKRLGPVAHPTTIEELDLEPIPPPKPIATGVVARPDVPPDLYALVVTPDLSRSEEIPFYAKLRAEADEALLRDGQGLLYLGFHLDPIYEVHWNNEVAPLSFEISTPEGVSVSPNSAQAPEVKVAADSDPREFLISARTSFPSPELDLTVRYFACDNANTFCIPVTQHYSIQLQPDPDGGRAPRRGPSEPERPAGFGVRNFLQRNDANGDGQLSRGEMPAPAARQFDRMDTNGDGFLSSDELAAGRPRRPPQRAEGDQQAGSFDPVSRLMSRDSNGDQKLSKDEVPPPMARRFAEIDTNGDGLLDVEELRERARQMRSQGGATPGTGPAEPENP